MKPTTTIMKQTMIMTCSAFHWPVERLVQMFPMALGRPTTMPAKMISDMPLPIPRSLICSPSHMMKAVPVVRVSIVMATKDQPGLSTKFPCEACKDVAIANDCASDRPTVR